MYDLHISCDQTDEIKGFIEIAEELGINGLVFTPKFSSLKNLEDFYEHIDELKEKTEIDIVKGVEIKAKSVKDLKKKIYKVRERATVVVVLGGDYKINRVSCEDSRVDVLSHPEYKRSDSGLDHVLAKKASENNVHIEINFRDILQTYGKVRSHVFAHIKKNLELAKKYEAPLVICSGARDKYELRGQKELSALLELFDLSKEESKRITQNVPRKLVEKNRKKVSGKIEFKGTEKIEEE
ncbi:MAG: ribonuclease P protein component 3 [Candidatus Aenigmatarchaeota archaeon]